MRHGSAALRTLDRALSQTAVLGVGTNVEFLRFLLAGHSINLLLLTTGVGGVPPIVGEAGAARNHSLLASNCPPVFGS